MDETPPQSNRNSATPREEKIVSSTEGKPTAPAEGLLDTLQHELLVLGRELAVFGRWCARDPLSGLALAAILATLVYFYYIVHPFAYRTTSLARWAWEAWNPEGDQSYGVLVPVIALWLFYYHRHELRQAELDEKQGGYLVGWVTLAFGIAIYVLSVRCLNPRLGLASIPFVLYGGICFAWGGKVARVLLFPCAFLIFMMPVGALEQATNNLQFIITGVVGKLTHLLGIAILAVGTTLTATDGSFNFEIAEGCSGIRSLTAMVMLTAVFVHLTQDRLWKKVLIFSCSLGFAIIGNIGRIFSIVLLARYYDPKIAAGVYHEYSGFLFFPIAILAMLLVSNLVNYRRGKRPSTTENATFSQPR